LATQIFIPQGVSEGAVRCGAVRCGAGLWLWLWLCSTWWGKVLTDRPQTDVADILTSMLYPSPWSGARRVAREYQAAMARADQALSLLSLEVGLNLRFAVAALRAAGDDPGAAGVRNTLDHGLTLDLGDFALRLAPGARVASHYLRLGIYRSNGRVAE
jgi:branched-chain amino acid transport system substrate-binding protein